MGDLQQPGKDGLLCAMTLGLRLDVSYEPARVGPQLSVLGFGAVHLAGMGVTRAAYEGGFAHTLGPLHW